MRKFLNKKLIIKFLSWSIVGVFFVMIVPIAINRIYKIPASLPIFAMNWDAKDVLGFYGSLLGSVSTIIAVIATIRSTLESQKEERDFLINNQREERKKSIQPYFQTQHSGICDITNGVFNEIVRYIYIHKTFFETYSSLPDELNDLLILKIRYNSDRTMYGKYVDKYFKHNFVMIYELKNYGANSAVGVKLENEANLAIKDFCVSNLESKKFVIILNDSLLSDGGSYKFTIRITYSDICSLGEYIQCESFEFLRLDTGELALMQGNDDFLTAPKEK